MSTVRIRTLFIFFIAESWTTFSLPRQRAWHSVAITNGCWMNTVEAEMWKCDLSWGWEAIREVFQNLSIGFLYEVFPVSHLNASWSLSSLCLSTSYIPLVFHLSHYLSVILYLHSWLLQRPGICWCPGPCFFHFSISDLIQCQVHICLLSKWTINSLSSSEGNNAIKYMVTFS